MHSFVACRGPEALNQGLLPRRQVALKYLATPVYLHSLMGIKGSDAALLGRLPRQAGVDSQQVLSSAWQRVANSVREW